MLRPFRTQRAEGSSGARPEWPDSLQRAVVKCESSFVRWVGPGGKGGGGRARSSSMCSGQIVKQVRTATLFPARAHLAQVHARATPISGARKRREKWTRRLRHPPWVPESLRPFFASFSGPGNGAGEHAVAIVERPLLPIHNMAQQAKSSLLALVPRRCDCGLLSAVYHTWFPRSRGRAARLHS